MHRVFLFNIFRYDLINNNYFYTYNRVTELWNQLHLLPVSKIWYIPHRLCKGIKVNRYDSSYIYIGRKRTVRHLIVKSVPPPCLFCECEFYFNHTQELVTRIMLPSIVSPLQTSKFLRHQLFFCNTYLWFGTHNFRLNIDVFTGEGYVVFTG